MSGGWGFREEVLLKNILILDHLSSELFFLPTLLFLMDIYFFNEFFCLHLKVKVILISVVAET